VIVTAHQPNWLPGVSVAEKVRASDAVVWLDEVQFTHGGWSNRNRMPDGSWLTVPIDRGTDMAPFNRVRISEHRDWRRRAAKTLHHHYGAASADVCAELARPYRLLIGLNLACLRVVLGGLGAAWHFQSHLDGGHSVMAVSDDLEELVPISERLALMTAEVGGTVYLSGASGRHYLDESPFRELGLTVEYFDWSGPNECSMSLLV
jgi:hypothetical protein